MKIPKIIHQVWEGKESPVIPPKLRILAESWKEHHPDWEYRLWRQQDMEQLVNEYFPGLWSLYNSFPYPVQRWDIIRYMILYIVGGVYTDLDTECFKPMQPLLENERLCFGEEPSIHNFYPEHQGKKIVGNAFMCSAPGEEGWLYVLSEVERSVRLYKKYIVLNTTGPLLFTRIQSVLSGQYGATVLPYQLVAPVSKGEVKKYAYGVEPESFLSKIKDAYCAHYFFGSWEGM